MLPERAIDSAFASLARGQSPRRLAGAVTASYAPVYYPATASRDEAVTIQVGEGEQRLGVDLLLVLTSTLRVQGTLVVRDPDYELGQATVFLFPAWQRSRNPPIRAVATSAGAFSFANVPPGHYRLGALSRARLRSTSAGRSPDYVPLWGEVEVFVAGGDAENVVVELKREEQTNLHGQLVVPPGSSPAAYQVVLFPASRSHWELAARLLATRPASDGAYFFQDVPAGDYCLAVLADLTLDWRDPAFLSSIVSQSVSVSVPNTGSAQVNLDAR
jgi:hypothetical protein